MDALSRLEAAIKTHEQEIYTALHTDLGKSETESFMCEVALVQIDTTPLITHRFKLNHIEDAYRVLENRLDNVIKIAIEC